MPPCVRHGLFSLAVLCLLLTNSLPARANSVTVTGTGFLGADSDQLGVTAGIFSAFSAAPFGPSFVGGLGTVGIPMTLSWYVLPFSFGHGFTRVNVGNQFTDILRGSILFTATFTIPASALVTQIFTTPVDASGQLQAFQDLTLDQPISTGGPLMATLSFTGTGTATFQLENVGQGEFVIRGADSVFEGKGTLQIVPEPTSVFLMGTGLAALAGIVRRKRIFVKRVGNS